MSNAGPVWDERVRLIALSLQQLSDGESTVGIEESGKGGEEHLLALAFGLRRCQDTQKHQVESGMFWWTLCTDFLAAVVHRQSHLDCWRSLTRGKSLPLGPTNKVANNLDSINWVVKPPRDRETFREFMPSSNCTNPLHTSANQLAPSTTLKSPPIQTLLLFLSLFPIISRGLHTM